MQSSTKLKVCLQYRTEFLINIYTSDKNNQINTNEIVETATIDSNEISENIEKILVNED